MIINCFRKYKKDCTMGEVFINGKFFGYTLEDPGRPANVKIPGDTCIPEGVYEVMVNHSPKFQRKMTLLRNKPDGAIERSGVRFTGIRVHGGNTHEHTAGCPLIASNTNHIDKVRGSLEKEFTELVSNHIAMGPSHPLWVVSEAI